MMTSPIILIDGMTGSGKSTCAQRLWFHLIAQGRPADWFYEHDTEHPIWRTGECQEAMLCANFEISAINALILGRWRDFCRQQAGADTVTILESAFFQRAVGFLLAMDAGLDVITEHVLAVERILEPLDPALIYFRQDDVGAALKAICADRRSDAYEQALVQYLAASPYGQRKHVDDFDGVIEFCLTWRHLVDSLFSRLRMRRLAIENSARRWDVYEKQITDFLAIPEIPSDLLLAPPLPPIDRYLGRFQDGASEDIITIAADSQGLYMDDARKTRLFRGEDARFHVQSMNLVLEFDDELCGAFHQLRLLGNLPRLSAQWYRVDEAGRLGSVA